MSDYSYDFYLKTLETLKASGFSPKCCFDIGSHNGDTVEITQKVWPQSRVILFEANEIFSPLYDSRYYEYNIVKLGECNRKTSFFKTKCNPASSGNSINREMTEDFNDENVIIEPCELVPLDFYSHLPYPEFVKIDTQGSELLILEGGKQILSNCKVLIIEAAIVNYNDGGCSKEQVVHECVKNGYSFIETIEFIHDSNRIIQENLLFIKK